MNVDFEGYRRTAVVCGDVAVVVVLVMMEEVLDMVVKSDGDLRR